MEPRPGLVPRPRPAPSAAGTRHAGEGRGGCGVRRRLGATGDRPGPATCSVTAGCPWASVKSWAPFGARTGRSSPRGRACPRPSASPHAGVGASPVRVSASCTPQTLLTALSAGAVRTLAGAAVSPEGGRERGPFGEGTPASFLAGKAFWLTRTWGKAQHPGRGPRRGREAEPWATQHGWRGVSERERPGKRCNVTS